MGPRSRLTGRCTRGQLALCCPSRDGEKVMMPWVRAGLRRREIRGRDREVGELGGGGIYACCLSRGTSSLRRTALRGCEEGLRFRCRSAGERGHHHLQ